MEKINIITPVKDSIELTLETVRSIMSSNITTPFSYTIYNDCSTPENTARLEVAAKEYGINLVNIASITTNPSPNYRLILQLAQKQSLVEKAGLLIIESDVVLEKDAIQSLFDEAVIRTDCGIAAAVTVDDEGKINYPYLYAKNRKKGVYEERKHLSFCCSLLTLNFLQSYSFEKLNPEKHWHDTAISNESKKNGFKNYLFTNISVLHHPHSSRPWKMLKYTNPFKYYWTKYTKGFDKI